MQLALKVYIKHPFYAILASLRPASKLIICFIFSYMIISSNVIDILQSLNRYDWISSVSNTRLSVEVFIIFLPQTIKRKQPLIEERIFSVCTSVVNVAWTRKAPEPLKFCADILQVWLLCTLKQFSFKIQFILISIRCFSDCRLCFRNYLRFLSFTIFTLFLQSLTL